MPANDDAPDLMSPRHDRSPRFASMPRGKRPGLICLSLICLSLICLEMGLLPRPAGAQTVDQAPCPPDSATNVIVSVKGMKDGQGNLRAELYPPERKDFAIHFLKRVQIRAPGRDVEICVPTPGPGTYAVIVVHDRTADGRLDVFRDGFGFSNNPRLGLGLPDISKVTFRAGAADTRLTVVLNYVHGLSVGPIAADPAADSASP